ncbi:MAG TPA: hypothetical protein VJS44_21360 [Pyrinomonadaceae bacterium]|nr:hypothetical protein [Pyrinomonadaceae bacterium]
MISLRKLIAFAIALAVAAALWLWWNRPQKVDMAAYVPADALVYLEANNLPEIVQGLSQTDAWKALAPPAGISSYIGEVGWLSRVPALTGIGSAETVVLSRAQIAIAVLSLEAADAGETLKIKPRYGVVAETHTSEWRTRSAVEKRIGAFAQRAYKTPTVERKKIDDIEFVTWKAPAGDRQIVAAVMGSIAVIGTDENSVRTILAVKRGERPSLLGNPGMEEMRKRVDAQTGAAFGYVSPQGAAQLLELGVAAYAGQISNNPQIQGAIASRLPQLANKLLGGAGWSARFVSGVVEDRYYLALQNGVAARLKEPLTPAAGSSGISASRLMPQETYRLTRYNYRNPSEAWRGFNAAISSQLDALGAVSVSILLKAALQPYGIEEPDAFLNAIGTEIVTVGLDNGSSGTVTIVEVRDEKALRDFVSKRLGPKPTVEKVGDAELLISRDEERGAASFVAGSLMLGSVDNVRRCLEARSEGRTLDASAPFQDSLRRASASPGVVTFTDDDASALALVTAIASESAARSRPFNEEETMRALERLPYTVTETNLVEGGFERRTRSAFGQFGSLISQFSPGSNQ